MLQIILWVSDSLNSSAGQHYIQYTDIQKIDLKFHINFSTKVLENHDMYATISLKVDLWGFFFL